MLHVLDCLSGPWSLPAVTAAGRANRAPALPSEAGRGRLPAMLLSLGRLPSVELSSWVSFALPLLPSSRVAGRGLRRIHPLPGRSAKNANIASTTAANGMVAGLAPSSSEEC